MFEGAVNRLQRSLNRIKAIQPLRLRNHRKTIEQIDWYLAQVEPGTLEAKIDFRHERGRVHATFQLTGIIFGQAVPFKDHPHVEQALEDLARIEDELG